MRRAWMVSILLWWSPWACVSRGGFGEDFGPCGEAGCLVQGVVEPAHPAGPNWNDYVAPEGGLACEPHLAQARGDCVHAGELRRVVVPTQRRCAELALEEELRAFTWKCDDGTGTAVFHSVGLREGARLADLVTETAFRPNRVVVRRRGVAVLETPRTAWWSNVVVPLPANDGSSVTELVDEGAIYVLTADASAGAYRLRAGRTALVVLVGAQLSSASPTAESLVTTAGDYHWIEGDLDAGSSAGGVHVVGGSFVVLRELRIQNGGAGLRLEGSRFALVRKVSVGRSRGDGLALQDAEGSVVSRLSISGAGAGGPGAAGVVLAGTSARNIFSEVLVTHARDAGVLVGGAGGDTFSHLTIANVAGAGVAVSAPNVTLAQVVSVNQGGAGLAVSASGARLANVVVLHNSGAGLSFASASDSVLSEGLWVGDNGVDCDVVGGVNVGLSPACLSGAQLRAGGVAAASFVGRVFVDDPESPSDVSGAQAATRAINWVALGSSLRSWGPDAGVFPDAAHRGPCASGQCRIWDWRLAPSDKVLRERSGAAAVANDAFVAGASCPAAVDGNRAVAAGGEGAFLVNALEPLADGAGDDDGLCEQAERCVYSPHLGAWQGDGALGADACVYVTGEVGGVTMLGRQ